eukprot:g518.t1
MLSNLKTALRGNEVAASAALHELNNMLSMNTGNLRIRPILGLLVQKANITLDTGGSQNLVNLIIRVLVNALDLDPDIACFITGEDPLPKDSEKNIVGSEGQADLNRSPSVNTVNTSKASNREENKWTKTDTPADDVLLSPSIAEIYISSDKNKVRKAAHILPRPSLTAEGSTSTMRAASNAASLSMSSASSTMYQSGSHSSESAKNILPCLTKLLQEINDIDTAEQAIKLLQILSEQFPHRVFNHGGLKAVTQYYDFFSSNVQRKVHKCIHNIIICWAQVRQMKVTFDRNANEEPPSATDGKADASQKQTRIHIPTHKHRTASFLRFLASKNSQDMVEAEEGEKEQKEYISDQDESQGDQGQYKTFTLASIKPTEPYRRLFSIASCSSAILKVLPLLISSITSHDGEIREIALSSICHIVKSFASMNKDTTLPLFLLNNIAGTDNRNFDSTIHYPLSLARPWGLHEDEWALCSLHYNAFATFTLHYCVHAIQGFPLQVQGGENSQKLQEGEIDRVNEDQVERVNEDLRLTLSTLPTQKTLSVKLRKPIEAYIRPQVQILRKCFGCPPTFRLLLRNRSTRDATAYTNPTNSLIATLINLISGVARVGSHIKVEAKCGLISTLTEAIRAVPSLIEDFLLVCDEKEQCDANKAMNNGRIEEERTHEPDSPFEANSLFLRMLSLLLVGFSTPSRPSSAFTSPALNAKSPASSLSPQTPPAVLSSSSPLTSPLLSPMSPRYHPFSPSKAKLSRGASDGFGKSNASTMSDKEIVLLIDLCLALIPGIPQNIEETYLSYCDEKNKNHFGFDMSSNANALNMKDIANERQSVLYFIEEITERIKKREKREKEYNKIREKEESEAEAEDLADREALGQSRNENNSDISSADNNSSTALPPGVWACKACTFHNAVNLSSCMICGTAKPKEKKKSVEDELQSSFSPEQKKLKAEVDERKRLRKIKMESLKRSNEFDEKWEEDRSDRCFAEKFPLAMSVMGVWRKRPTLCFQLVPILVKGLTTLALETTKEKFMGAALSGATALLHHVPVEVLVDVNYTDPQSHKEGTEEQGNDVGSNEEQDHCPSIEISVFEGVVPVIAAAIQTRLLPVVRAGLVTACILLQKINRSKSSAWLERHGALQQIISLKNEMKQDDESDAVVEKSFDASIVAKQKRGLCDDSTAKAITSKSRQRLRQSLRVRIHELLERVLSLYGYKDGDISTLNEIHEVATVEKGKEKDTKTNLSGSGVREVSLLKLENATAYEIHEHQLERKLLFKFWGEQGIGTQKQQLTEAVKDAPTTSTTRSTSLPRLTKREVADLVDANLSPVFKFIQNRGRAYYYNKNESSEEFNLVSNQLSSAQLNLFEFVNRLQTPQETPRSRLAQILQNIVEAVNRDENFVVTKQYPCLHENLLYESLSDVFNLTGKLQKRVTRVQKRRYHRMQARLRRKRRRSGIVEPTTRGSASGEDNTFHPLFGLYHERNRMKKTGRTEQPTQHQDSSQPLRRSDFGYSRPKGKTGVKQKRRYKRRRPKDANYNPDHRFWGGVDLPLSKKSKTTLRLLNHSMIRENDDNQKQSNSYSLEDFLNGHPSTEYYGNTLPSIDRTPSLLHSSDERVFIEAGTGHQENNNVGASPRAVDPGNQHALHPNEILQLILHGTLPQETQDRIFNSNFDSDYSEQIENISQLGAFGAIGETLHQRQLEEQQSRSSQTSDTQPITADSSLSSHLHSRYGDVSVAMLGRPEVVGGSGEQLNFRLSEHLRMSLHSLFRPLKVVLRLNDDDMFDDFDNNRKSPQIGIQRLMKFIRKAFLPRVILIEPHTPLNFVYNFVWSRLLFVQHYCLRLWPMIVALQNDEQKFTEQIKYKLTSLAYAPLLKVPSLQWRRSQYPFCLTVGMKLDCLDHFFKWYVATIIGIGIAGNLDSRWGCKRMYHLIDNHPANLFRKKGMPKQNSKKIIASETPEEKDSPTLGDLGKRHNLSRSVIMKYGVIKVTYDGWGSKYDEWIPCSSLRLSFPSGSKTALGAGNSDALTGYCVAILEGGGAAVGSRGKAARAYNAHLANSVYAYRELVDKAKEQEERTTADGEDGEDDECRNTKLDEAGGFSNQSKVEIPALPVNSESVQNNLASSTSSTRNSSFRSNVDTNYGSCRTNREDSDMNASEEYRTDQHLTNSKPLQEGEQEKEDEDTNVEGEKIPKENEHSSSSALGISVNQLTSENSLLPPVPNVSADERDYSQSPDITTSQTSCILSPEEVPYVEKFIGGASTNVLHQMKENGRNNDIDGQHLHISPLHLGLRYPLYVGGWVDVLDERGTWCTAQILSIKSKVIELPLYGAEAFARSSIEAERKRELELINKRADERRRREIRARKASELEEAKRRYGKRIEKRERNRQAENNLCKNRKSTVELSVSEAIGAQYGRQYDLVDCNFEMALRTGTAQTIILSGKVPVVNVEKAEGNEDIKEGDKKKGKRKEKKKKESNLHSGPSSLNDMEGEDEWMSEYGNTKNDTPKDIPTNVRPAPSPKSSVKRSRGECVVIRRIPSAVLVHYDGWNSRWDEWVPLTSKRVRPLSRDSERGTMSKWTIESRAAINKEKRKKEPAFLHEWYIEEHDRKAVHLDFSDEIFGIDNDDYDHFGVKYYPRKFRFRKNDTKFTMEEFFAGREFERSIFSEEFDLYKFRKGKLYDDDKFYFAPLFGDSIMAMLMMEGIGYRSLRQFLRQRAKRKREKWYITYDHQNEYEHQWGTSDIDSVDEEFNEIHKREEDMTLQLIARREAERKARKREDSIFYRRKSTATSQGSTAPPTHRLRAASAPGLGKNNLSSAASGVSSERNRSGSFLQNAMYSLRKLMTPRKSDDSSSLSPVSSSSSINTNEQEERGTGRNSEAAINQEPLSFSEVEQVTIDGSDGDTDEREGEDSELCTNDKGKDSPDLSLKAVVSRDARFRSQEEDIATRGLIAACVPFARGERVFTCYEVNGQRLWYEATITNVYCFAVRAGNKRKQRIKKKIAELKEGREKEKMRGKRKPKKNFENSSISSLDESDNPSDSSSDDDEKCQSLNTNARKRIIANNDQNDDFYAMGEDPVTLCFAIDDDEAEIRRSPEISAVATEIEKGVTMGSKSSFDFGVLPKKPFLEKCRSSENYDFRYFFDLVYDDGDRRGFVQESEICTELPNSDALIVRAQVKSANRDISWSRRFWRDKINIISRKSLLAGADRRIQSDYEKQLRTRAILETDRTQALYRARRKEEERIEEEERKNNRGILSSFSSSKRKHEEHPFDHVGGHGLFGDSLSFTQLLTIPIAGGLMTGSVEKFRKTRAYETPHMKRLSRSRDSERLRMKEIEKDRITYLVCGKPVVLHHIAKGKEEIKHDKPSKRQVLCGGGIACYGSFQVGSICAAKVYENSHLRLLHLGISLPAKKDYSNTIQSLNTMDPEFQFNARQKRSLRVSATLLQSALDGSFRSARERRRARWIRRESRKDRQARQRRNKEYAIKRRAHNKLGRLQLHGDVTLEGRNHQMDEKGRGLLAAILNGNESEEELDDGSKRFGSELLFRRSRGHSLFQRTTSYGPIDIPKSIVEIHMLNVALRHFTARWIQGWFLHNPMIEPNMLSLKEKTIISDLENFRDKLVANQNDYGDTVFQNSVMVKPSRGQRIICLLFEHLHQEHIFTSNEMHIKDLRMTRKVLEQKQNYNEEFEGKIGTLTELPLPKTSLEESKEGAKGRRRVNQIDFIIDLSMYVDEVHNENTNSTDPASLAFSDSCMNLTLGASRLQSAMSLNFFAIPPPSESLRVLMQPMIHDLSQYNCTRKGNSSSEDEQSHISQSVHDALRAIGYGIPPLMKLNFAQGVDLSMPVFAPRLQHKPSCSPFVLENMISKEVETLFKKNVAEGSLIRLSRFYHSETTIAKAQFNQTMWQYVVNGVRCTNGIVSKVNKSWLKPREEQQQREEQCSKELHKFAKEQLLPFRGALKRDWSVWERLFYLDIPTPSEKDYPENLNLFQIVMMPPRYRNFTDEESKSTGKSSKAKKDHLTLKEHLNSTKRRNYQKHLEYVQRMVTVWHHEADQKWHDLSLSERRKRRYFQRFNAIVSCRPAEVKHTTLKTLLNIGLIPVMAAPSKEDELKIRQSLAQHGANVTTMSSLYPRATTTIGLTSNSKELGLPNKTSDSKRKHVVFPTLSVYCPFSPAFKEGNFGKGLFFDHTIFENNKHLLRNSLYFELEVLVPGLAQVGFAVVESFHPDEMAGSGVGDDAVSWAYDGYRVQAWHKGKAYQRKRSKTTPQRSKSTSRRRNRVEKKAPEPAFAFGKKWKAGDIIGCALNRTTGTISFSLNGSWESPMGDCFQNIQAKTATSNAKLAPIDSSILIAPALSFSPSFAGKLCLSEWIYEPPHPSDLSSSLLHPSSTSSTATVKTNPHFKSVVPELQDLTTTHTEGVEDNHQECLRKVVASYLQGRFFEPLFKQAPPEAYIVGDNAEVVTNPAKEKETKQINTTTVIEEAIEATREDDFSHLSSGVDKLRQLCSDHIVLPVQNSMDSRAMQPIVDILQSGVVAAILEQSGRDYQPSNNNKTLPVSGAADLFSNNTRPEKDNCTPSMVVSDQNIPGAKEHNQQDSREVRIGLMEGFEDARQTLSGLLLAQLLSGLHRDFDVVRSRNIWRAQAIEKLQMFISDDNDEGIYSNGSSSSSISSFILDALRDPFAGIGEIEFHNENETVTKHLETSFEILGMKNRPEEKSSSSSHSNSINLNLSANLNNQLYDDNDQESGTSTAAASSLPCLQLGPQAMSISGNLRLF